MTVTTTTTYSELVGNGLATAFPFTFAVPSADEVKVSLDGVVQSGGYSVALAASGTGGTVAFDAAPANGVAVLIESDPDFTQESSFASEGNFNPATFDRVHDRLTAYTLWLRARVAALFPFSFPATSARVGKFLGFDADGNGVLLSGTGNDSAFRTDLAASAFWAVARTAQAKLREIVTLKDFGAVGDGTANDTAAIQAALNAAAGGAVIDGSGLPYRTTAKINIPAKTRLRNASFIIDHTASAFGKSSGLIDRCHFDGVRLYAKQASAIAWDCDQFQYCLWSNCFVGTLDGSAKFGTAWKLYNVAYWNVFVAPEVEQVANYGWDLNDANDTRAYMPRHVDFTGTPKAALYFSGGCSGTAWFGPSFEAKWAQAPIQFAAACQANDIFGGRVELRSGGVATTAVLFNGCSLNTVLGLYALGVDASDAPGNNFSHILTASNSAVHALGTGQFFPSQNTSNADTAGGIIYNTSRSRFTGYAGGQRDFAMSPSLDNIDLNGHNLVSGGTQLIAGARGTAVTPPSGGTTVDAQARTAINDLIARLQTHGLIA